MPVSIDFFFFQPAEIEAQLTAAGFTAGRVPRAGAVPRGGAPQPARLPAGPQAASPTLTRNPLRNPRGRGANRALTPPLPRAGDDVGEADIRAAQRLGGWGARSAGNVVPGGHNRADHNGVRCRRDAVTSSSHKIEHIVVIGGGAAGCATAYYLSKAGARVTIVEREGVGNGASGWSAGGLNPLQGIPEPILALAMESYRLHLELWPELAAAQQPEPRIRPDLDGVRRARRGHHPRPQDAGRGVRGGRRLHRALDRDGRATPLEPRITPNVAGALLTHGNAVLESHRLTVALSEAAQQLGATLTDGNVTGLVHDDRRVTGVLLDDAVIPCDAVVVAMGPWSGAAEGVAWRAGAGRAAQRRDRADDDCRRAAPVRHRRAGHLAVRAA